MPVSKKKTANWTYENKEVTLISQMPANVYGFCYQIQILFEDKYLYYIGQKKLISRRKKKMTKKEIEQMPNKRAKKWYYVETEMDWQGYNGSNKVLLALIKEHGEEKLFLQKQILQYAFCEQELKYLEAREILCSNSLLQDCYFNDGCSIRQFGKLKFLQ